jgi:hypothetical protein
MNQPSHEYKLCFCYVQKIRVKHKFCDKLGGTCILSSSGLLHIIVCCWIPTFWRHILSTMKTEAVSPSKALILTYQSTHCHNPDDHNMNLQHCQNLNPYTNFMVNFFMRVNACRGTYTSPLSLCLIYSCMLYLLVLPGSQTKWCWMVWWLVNNGWERCGRKQSSDWGTIVAFVWGEWGELWKSSDRIVNISQDLKCAFPIMQGNLLSHTVSSVGLKMLCIHNIMLNKLTIDLQISAHGVKVESKIHPYLRHRRQTCR